MWRERLLRHLARCAQLGYPESFVRLWEFYLCYCEGGFAERQLGDVQMLLTKPRYRGLAGAAGWAGREERLVGGDEFRQRLAARALRAPARDTPPPGPAALPRG